MNIRFTVPFIAVQERPRRVTRGNRSWWYSPTSKEQALIGSIALVARQKHKTPLLTGPCCVAVHVTGLKRGDLDNVVKALLDACNKVIWKDDRQVKQIHAYATETGNPQMEVSILDACYDPSD